MKGFTFRMRSSGGTSVEVTAHEDSDLTEVTHSFVAFLHGCQFIVTSDVVLRAVKEAMSDRKTMNDEDQADPVRAGAGSSDCSSEVRDS